MVADTQAAQNAEWKQDHTDDSQGGHVARQPSGRAISLEQSSSLVDIPANAVPEKCGAQDATYVATLVDPDATAAMIKGKPAGMPGKTRITSRKASGGGGGAPHPKLSTGPREMEAK
jgi:hypothetical protein